MCAIRSRARAVPPTTKAADLDGDDPDRRVATALMLRVMPGDRFELKAESYRDAELGVGSLGTDGDGIMNALLNGLLGGAAGGEQGGGGGEEGGMNNTQLLNHAFSGDIAQQWEALSGDPLQQDSLAPQSHLNYIVLDENMHVVGSQSGVMQAGAPGQWENVAMNGPMEIGQAGYLLVFTSNKTSGSVFWDNVDLTFYRGQLLEENHYYPFGLTLATTSANPAEENRMKLTTKELQSELGVNWYDFGARMLDEQIGRWNGVDPLGEKFPWQSVYTFVDNNPVLKSDPTGMAAYVDPDNFVFNQSGEFQRIEENDQPDKLVIENSLTKQRQEYQFSDPANDTKQIRDGIITKVLFASVEQAADMIGHAGGFNSFNRFNNMHYLRQESQGGGKLDFSYSSIPIWYKEDGASNDPLTKSSPMLFIPHGEKYAFNHMNFGNFLWGAAGTSLGLDGITLRVAAHLNSKFGSKNGYDSQWDSADDQLSIQEGINFSLRNSFRNRTWKHNEGLSPSDTRSHE